MLLQELRESVVEVCMILYDFRLVGIRDGNISARDPHTNLIAIKPSLFWYPKLMPRDIAIVDLDGNLIEGDHKQSSETPMHACVYRNRKDINGVIHSHAPFATAWSVANKPIPSVIANQVTTNGAIPIAEYTRPGTLELGEKALATMGNGYAVILQNHGPLCIGKTLEQALMITLSIEDAAKIAFLAQLINGQNINYLTEEFFIEMRGERK